MAVTWSIGLMAQDYVTLNPTAFTRIRPGNDVVIEADTFDQKGKTAGSGNIRRLHDDGRAELGGFGGEFVDIVGAQ